MKIISSTRTGITTANFETLSARAHELLQQSGVQGLSVQYAMLTVSFPGKLLQDFGWNLAVTFH